MSIEQEFVKKLIRLTIDGKVDWKETAHAETFQFTFSQGTIQIAESDGCDYTLLVYNQDCVLVTEMLDATLPRVLYRHARDTARNSEKVIMTLLAELDTMEDK